MTAHLSPHELVDAIDATLEAARRDHLDRCGQCRDELELLRAVVTDVRPAGDIVPPSPLFWEHFPGRVHAAIESDASSSLSRWRFGWLTVAGTGAAVALAALVIVLRPVAPELPRVDRTIVQSVPPPIVAPSATDAAIDGGRVGADISAAEESSPAAARSWQLVIRAGRSASAADVHSVVPVDPATGVLIEDLSQRELQEFARLIRAQTGGVQ